MPDRHIVHFSVSFFFFQSVHVDWCGYRCACQQGASYETRAESIKHKIVTSDHKQECSEERTQQGPQALRSVEDADDFCFVFRIKIGRDAVAGHLDADAANALTKTRSQRCCYVVISGSAHVNKSEQPERDEGHAHQSYTAKDGFSSAVFGNDIAHAGWSHNDGDTVNGEDETSSLGADTFVFKFQGHKRSDDTETTAGKHCYQADAQKKWA